MDWLQVLRGMLPQTQGVLSLYHSGSTNYHPTLTCLSKFVSASINSKYVTLYFQLVCQRRQALPRANAASARKRFLASPVIPSLCARERARLDELLCRGHALLVYSQDYSQDVR